MAKLSVIVCVYNTDEKLFDDCLYSIFESSVTDLEVIVVNDGSSVDYTKIQKKYPKAKFIKTENNGTLSARLTGIKAATSPYVCFVDSDDVVSFVYFESSLKQIEAKEADIVLNDWAFFTEKTKYVCSNDTSISTDFLLKGDNVLTKFFKTEGTEHSYYVLWNKIFTRKVLEKVVKEIEALKISGKLIFAEDTLMTYYAFKHAKTITNTHFGYYFYRIHANQEILVDSEVKLKTHIKSMASVLGFIEKDLKDISRFDDVAEKLLNWKRLMIATNYAVAKKSGYETLFETIKKAYKVKDFPSMPKGAEKPYQKHQLLPLNIDQIDTALKKVYYSNRMFKVYSKKNTYTFLMLLKMKSVLKKKFIMVSTKADAMLVMPEEEFSLKLKLLHNHFIYKFGMILFPKGSKIRQKLKSKL